MIVKRGFNGEPRIVRAKNAFSITEHFRLHEFECRCCGRLVLANSLPRMLEELRLAWGGPLAVTSGYRCERRNRAVGGVPDSLHLCGRAADIKASPQEQAALARLARAIGFQEIILGNNKNYIHLGI
jgi:hypothetical protein